MIRAFLAAATFVAFAIGVPLAGGSTLDAATPTITSSTPNSPANENNPTLDGTADPGTAVTIYTDDACAGGAAGTGTADATSGEFHIPVTVGDNSTTTFYAAATDATPSTSPCSAGFTYVEDSLPPPAPDVTGHPPNPSNDTSPTFVFSDSEAGITFNCRLQSGPFPSCTSPRTYGPLNPGTYTFYVKASDAAGNESESATFTWTIDTTPPPAPSIDTQPPNPSGSSDASFTFHDPEPGVTISCRHDGLPFADCSSGSQSYGGLPDGLHTFDVQARDAAGNPSGVASYSWAIDASPPSPPTITSAPANPSGSGDATFTFSGDGDPTASLLCQIDNGTFTDCSSGSKSYAGLPDGPRTFGVKEVDKFGHSSGVTTYTWTIDTVHPLVTLTDKPPLLTNRTTASLSFTANQPASTFQCRLDGGSFDGCTSPRLYNGLGNGSHTFAVRAKSLGNVGLTTTYTWRVDTVPPQTAIASVPPAQSTSPIANFTFTSSETGSSFSCSLDSAGFAPCVSPKTYAGLGDGAHVFRVQAVDAAGNVDASASTYAWQIRGVGPPTVDHAPPGNVTQVRRSVGYGVLKLRWKRPPDSDFDHVRVYLAASTKGAARAVVYSGKSQTYTNKRFRNGLYYRYLIVAYDHADNGAGGVSAVVPPSVLLGSPRNGAVVHSPPILRWTPVRKATFYNVQVYYRGQKVLSAWPEKPRRALTRRWVYSGRDLTLRKGTYLWYVWPGFGSKAKSRYGQLLGQGTFRVR